MFRNNKRIENGVAGAGIPSRIAEGPIYGVSITEHAVCPMY